ncbi:MAG TPA: NAD(P)H-dependent oxidoreductase [Sphingobacteriaceae bacterium]
MEKMPLVILGTSRENSTTLKVTETVLCGMAFNVVPLHDLEIAPYDYSGAYPPTDDFPAVTEHLLNHNVIIFATPVYWYSMSALMKAFFDRLTDLVTIRKETGRKLQGKSTFLVAAGTDRDLPEGFEVPFRLTSAYLRMHYRLGAYQSARFPEHPENHSAFRDAVMRHI